MATASAEEKQAVMAKWGAWLEALEKKGQLVTAGSPLEPGAKRLKKDGVVRRTSRRRSSRSCA